MSAILPTVALTLDTHSSGTLLTTTTFDPPTSQCNGVVSTDRPTSRRRRLPSFIPLHRDTLVRNIAEIYRYHPGGQASASNANTGGGGTEKLSKSFAFPSFTSHHHPLHTTWVPHHLRCPWHSFSPLHRNGVRIYEILFNCLLTV